MRLYDSLTCQQALLDGCAAMLSITLPADVPLPPGQTGEPDALWASRVLLQSDPGPIDRLMNHLLAALPAADAP